MVLGQVAEGYGVADLRVGGEVELVVETLYTDETGDRTIWRWQARDRAGRGGRPVSTTSPSWAWACTRGASGAATSSSTACTRPGPPSPTPASTGATSTWSSAARRSATATAATSPAPPSPRRSAGTARRVATSYAACATGAQALDTARARILAGLSRGRARGRRRHHAQGLPRAERGRALGRPGLAAVPAARHDQPGVLRAVRAAPDGPLRRDAGGLRPGQGQERPARAGQPERALPQGGQPSRTCSPAPWSATRCTCSTSARPPTARPRSC